MKQKILSAILVSAVILSMAGCGGAQPTEIPNNSQESEVTASTTSATTEKQEQTTTEATTTTTETTTAPEEVSEPEEAIKVNNSYSINKGTWCFKADDDEYYYYDIANNRLIKKGSNYSMERWCFLIGDLLYSPNSGYIIDSKTGETVLPDGCKLKDVNKKSGLILVSKLDEGFSGNTFSLGVLNSNLEWVYPLTEITVDGKSTGDLDYQGYNLVGNYAVASGGYSSSFAYSFKENKTVGISTGVDSFFYCLNNDGDKALINRTYVFDGSTGKTTEIDSYSVHAAGDEMVAMDINRENWSVLSWNDYKDIGFDLSEYNVYEIYAATEDYIVFDAKNPDGDDYTIIMKKDGTLVVDPIKGRSESDYMHIYGDYVVYANAYVESFVLNCKTGEMKTYSDENLSLEGFDFTSGKLIMKSDGNYYLADITDPETLINPFEIAEIQ